METKKQIYTTSVLINHLQHESEKITCLTDEELACFCEKDQLKEKASTDQKQKIKQIKAHFLDCNDCFERWIALSETLELIEQLDCDSLKNLKPEVVTISWIQRIKDFFPIPSMPVLATGFASIFAFFLVSPFFLQPQTGLERQIQSSFSQYKQIWSQPNQDHWQTQGVSKSLFNLVTYPDKEAFSSGVRQGLNELVTDKKSWKGVLSRLPKKPLDCKQMNKIDQHKCKDANYLLSLTGRWSVVALMSCQQNSVLTANNQEYWQQQWDLLSVLQGSYKKQTYYPNFKRRINDFSNSVIISSNDNQKYQNFCNGVIDLISYAVQR